MPHSASETVDEARESRWRAHATLALLTLAYALNFLDRQIVNVLLVPIQREFGVSDAALGALAGLSFALLFTLAGIPLAQWADRGSRRDLLALGLLVWSGMTALCGAAQNFVQLALARVGVGLGEASCVPSAHSLLSDLYPRERRAAALAVFSSGIFLGSLAGYALGGWLGERGAWRTAFVVAGLPGVLLALIVRLVLREPARANDATRAGPASPSVALERGASLRAGLAELVRNRLFVELALAASATSIVGYGYATWNAALLTRVHHLPLGEAGAKLGWIYGLSGMLGSAGFGWLATRLARRDARWLLGVPALALLVAIPCYALYVTSTELDRALVFLGLSQLCASSWFGPLFAAVQGAVPPARRALAAALLLAVLTLLGLGLGPWLVGAGNDWFRAELGDRGIVRSLLCLLAIELPAVALLARAALVRRAEPSSAA